jgi:hypothetical protein
MSEDKVQIRFEVSINGELQCTAGVEDGSVLFQSISYHPNAYNDGEKEAINDSTDVNTEGSSNKEIPFSLDVMGSDKNEHLNWLWKNLGIGDEVTIRVLGSGSMTPPTKRPRE